ncbi:MAG TPA: four helix bundle protein [Vicinamibacterales bacterium]|nr:four helix bundle protein [Vicinamibacterales bacterium]
MRVHQVRWRGGMCDAAVARMAGARSPEELIAWQLAYELKLRVYALLKTGPITRDAKLTDQLRSAAGAAPRLIAEGFGRYLPGDFARYLRTANGELHETFDALRDGVDRGYFTQDQVVPLQRLSKRASKAASGLIKYLRTSTAPHETRRRHSRRNEPVRSGPAPEPPEPPEPDPEPPEPDEPIEPA